MEKPAVKRAKLSGNEPGYSSIASYLEVAPSTAYSCVYFLVGDPKKRTPEKIAASKLHLMAHSVPMRKMLEESEIAARDIVTLEDVEPDTFRNFVQFVNGCDVIRHLTLEEGVALIYVAEKYIVEDLKRKLGQHLDVMVNIRNVFLLMVKPECLEEPRLKKAVDEIIQQQTNDLVSREEFLHLNSFGLMNIVTQKVLNLTEIELWRALLRWAKHNAQSEEGSKLRELLDGAIKYVRFCTLDLTDFTAEVATTDILSDSEIASINKAIGGKAEFDKSPTICYELIKRDFLGRKYFLDIDFLAWGFKKIDLSNTSYIYLTTKTQTVYLRKAIVQTQTPSCSHKTNSTPKSGKVCLTKITDDFTNTSSEMPIDCVFTEKLPATDLSVTISFPEKMTLKPESKYRLEFISMDFFQRFHCSQEDIVIDRDALMVSFNSDCPVTHFNWLTFTTCLPTIPPNPTLPFPATASAFSGSTSPFGQPSSVFTFGR